MAGSTQAPGIVMVYDLLPFLARMTGACMCMQAGLVMVGVPYVVLVWERVEGGKSEGLRRGGEGGRAAEAAAAATRELDDHF